LLSGEIDAWADVPADAVGALEAAPDVQVHSHPTPAWQMLLIQTRSDALLRDPRIRQAISHAIDRDRVAREVTGSTASVNPSAVAVSSPFFSAAHRKSLGYDPARARALLKEAGYDGRPLRIHASGDAYPSFYRSAVLLRDMLREVGINAEVEEMDWATQARRYAENDFQLSSMAYSMRTHPTLMYSAIIGQKTDHKWYLWEDLEADLWVAQSVFAGSDAERQALFDKLHARMLDIAPLVGLFNVVRVDAVREGVKGFAPWALGVPRFWGVSKP
ncbi:MAG TPA: ABC transporter substrate-binding protein, partial [Vicinamibacteria bacterium]|nr:ABC transporter substrate-binding protein [Vicinamibacteria bacterium]